MALGYSSAIRTARLAAVGDAIDGGAGAGVIRLYNGTRPATGGAATTLLSEHTCSDPCLASNDGVQAVFDAIGDDASANADGTATWFRALDSTGTFCFDGSIPDDMTINSAVIAEGQPVSIESAVINAGNQ